MPHTVWPAIHQRLQAAAWQLPYPPDAWPWHTTHREPYLKLEWDWKHLELFHAYEIDQAVNHWMKTGQWQQGLKPDALYFLHARLTTAADFACIHNSGKNDPPLPAPPSPEAEEPILHWLLTHWWETHGRANAIHDWIFEQWERQFDPTS